MPIVGGLDIHRKQVTFDYLDTGTGQVQRGQVCPADREHLRAWLTRFHGRGDVGFALEACTGWRYVAEELTAAGITPHLAEPADTAFARGRKRHAKTDKTDSRHLLAEGRLPECWIPPGRILECRALLELYNDLRRERTSWGRGGSPPPARRSGSPGWTSPSTPLTVRARPGACPGRDRRCCAGRSMRPARPTPAPLPRTTPTTPR